jgi:hypothetical protein
MSKNKASIIDQLYFDLAFKIDWSPDMEELFEQARNIHKQEIQEAFIEGSKLEFVNENSFSQSLEARFEALVFYASKYQDNE